MACSGRTPIKSYTNEAVGIKLYKKYAMFQLYTLQLVQLFTLQQSVIGMLLE